MTYRTSLESFFWPKTRALRGISWGAWEEKRKRGIWIFCHRHTPIVPTPALLFIHSFIHPSFIHHHHKIQIKASGTLSNSLVVASEERSIAKASVETLFSSCHSGTKTSALNAHRAGWWIFLAVKNRLEGHSKLLSFSSRRGFYLSSILPLYLHSLYIQNHDAKDKRKKAVLCCSSAAFASHFVCRASTGIAIFDRKFSLLFASVCDWIIIIMMWTSSCQALAHTGIPSLNMSQKRCKRCVLPL